MKSSIWKLTFFFLHSYIIIFWAMTKILSIQYFLILDKICLKHIQLFRISQELVVQPRCNLAGCLSIRHISEKNTGLSEWIKVKMIPFFGYRVIPTEENIQTEHWQKWTQMTMDDSMMWTHISCGHTNHKYTEVKSCHSDWNKWRVYLWTNFEIKMTKQRETWKWTLLKSDSMTLELGSYSER